MIWYSIIKRQGKRNESFSQNDHPVYDLIFKQILNEMYEDQSEFEARNL